MSNFKVKIQPKINIKSRYIKTLRANHLYFKAKIPKVFTSKNIIEKNIYNKFYKTYSDTNNCYNIKIISEIITNQRSHIVAEFKDFLIKDDNSEFIWKFYPSKESRKLLISIFYYYNQTSVVFPTYILLSENKYLYKNIQRKQKLINILEEKDENIINHKKIGYDTDDFFDTSNKVFNSNILDSILNESNTSQIKKSLFGVSTENSNVTDNDGDNRVNILVNNINKIEEKLYVDFLNKKKLKIDKNIIYKKNNSSKEEISKKEKEKHFMKIKKIVDKVNNKNVIISRNRHKSVEISKYSKFTQNESQLNNNKKRSKTESINDTFYFNKILNKNNDIMFSFKNSNENEKSIDNNKNIIYNNIYKTDLYLNINNNIIIKESKNKSKENKSKNYTKVNKNIVNKLDLKKLKNINIPKKIIHSDKRKYIKKNDINNLLLSISSSNKEIRGSKREYKHSSNKTEREKEKEIIFDRNYNKNIIKHRKNKTDILIENYNKIKNDTSRTLEIKKNNKLMINNFKNTLNNLMSVINKKSFKRNINTKQKNITNYRNGYSNKYSSSIYNKEKIRFIESYYDSITNTRYKSMKIKNKKYKTNEENLTTYKDSLTFRRNISNDSKLIHNTQRNSKNKNMITTLNSAKTRKIKKIINNFNPYQYDEKKKYKKINLKKINENNKKEIFSLTARESNINDRNKYKKNFKINYTSFINRTNQTFKISENGLNTPNFNYNLYGRPKSFGNKKEYFKNNSLNNKVYLSLPKKLNKHHKKIFRTDFNNILRERIDKLNKTVKFKRDPLYNKLMTSKNNSKLDSSLFGNTNTNIILNINQKSIIKTKEISKSIKKEPKNINLNKNSKQKIKRFKSMCSSKKNNEINYSQIELRKKKYRDINKNKRGYRINANIKNNKNKFNNSSYTDRNYQKKNLRANSLVNKI